MTSTTDKQKPFYYIAGSTFYTDEQLKKILDGIEDCETETFSPEDFSSGSFFSYISTAPLFSENKAAVVRAFETVKSPEDIVAGCAGCRESVIIFISEETKLSKSLSSALSNAGFRQLVEQKAQKYDLTGKIISMFTEAGFRIDTAAAGEINEIFNGNLALIKSETDKLTAFFAYKKPKDQSEILNAITAKKNDSIFSFIDAFTRKRKKECIVLLSEFIDSGENLMILISLVFKRMKEVYLYSVSKELIKENRPFMLEKIKSGAGAWKKDELIKLFTVFAEQDYLFKTGRTREAAYLSMLINQM